jgi:hypothetical protein
MSQLSLVRGRRSAARARTLATRGALLASAIAVFTPAASAATGPYPVTVSEPADLKNHTVYRPTSGPDGGTMPVLAWGNGACLANGLAYSSFLTEIASHGILVVVSGGPGQLGATTAGYMQRSLDWAKYQNTKPGGAYQGKLDAAKMVVAGHSCGGLEAYDVAARRTDIAGVGIMNSGQLTQNQAQLDAMRAPVLYVLGGTGDVAYANGVRDFGRLPAALPAVLSTNGAGHMGTYWNKDGGMYSQVLKDWVLWNVKGSANAAARFTGSPCGLCTANGWTVQRHNIS